MRRRIGRTPEVSKLEELRSRTDRELLEVVGRSLEHGVISAEEASAHFDLGERGLANDQLAKAERAYNESAALLPLVRGHSLQQKVRLEDRRRDLQRKLDQLHARWDGRRRMACCG